MGLGLEEKKGREVDDGWREESGKRSRASEQKVQIEGRERFES